MKNRKIIIISTTHVLLRNLLPYFIEVSWRINVLYYVQDFKDNFIGIKTSKPHNASIIRTKKRVRLSEALHTCTYITVMFTKGKYASYGITDPGNEMLTNASKKKKKNKEKRKTKHEKTNQRIT